MTHDDIRDKTFYKPDMALIETSIATLRGSVLPDQCDLEGALNKD